MKKENLKKEFQELKKAYTKNINEENMTTTLKNNACKYLQKVPDKRQEGRFLYKCDLLKADDVDKKFHVIATAYEKQYPEKQMVPNGECFWVRQENLKVCPLFKEK